MSKKQISEIQVGDQVVINTESSRQPYVIGNAEKITATQITVNGERYNKRTGVRIGDSETWGRRQRLAETWPTGLMTIEEANKANEEAKNKWIAQNLAVKIKDASLGRLKELPIDTLREVVRLLGLEDGEK